MRGESRKPWFLKRSYLYEKSEFGSEHENKITPGG